MSSIAKEASSELFEKILKIKTIKQISIELNVAKGTVTRWVETKNVPNQYYIDLCRILGVSPVLNKLSFKEKDQYFTNKDTAIDCYNTFIEFTGVKPKDYIFIEPSCGDGVFLSLFPEDNRIGIDIEPVSDQAIKADYLSWGPDETEKKYIVIGNPPFGLRGHMALKFINHSSKFCDYVCFILPQLFASDGKGSPGKRVTDMNLIFSRPLTNNEFEFPDNKKVSVNCVFQIWRHKKLGNSGAISFTESNRTGIKVVSLSDGGTPSSTRNKKLLDKCDLYLPSTCFGKEKMKAYDSFESLPNRRGYGILFLSVDKKPELVSNAKEINWHEKAFLSTNGSYNLNKTTILCNI